MPRTHPSQPKKKRIRSADEKVRRRDYDRNWRSQNFSYPSREPERKTPPPLTGYRKVQVAYFCGPYAVVALPDNQFAWLDARLTAPDGLDTARYPTAEETLAALHVYILHTFDCRNPEGA